MKVIYVASPHGGKQENIERNADYCIYVIGEGSKNNEVCVPISPHHNFSYLRESDARELALMLGKKLIDACDEAWFFIERGRSRGMVDEEQYCREIRKPVKHINNNLITTISNGRIYLHEGFTTTID